MSIVSSNRKFLLGIFVFSLLFFTTFSFALAQQGGGTDLNKPIQNADTMLALTQAIMELAIGLCVLAAAIYIAIGSFYYFAASGNAKLAEQGKQIITRSILGLIIALISWLILNTIHPQFASQLKDPKFQSGAPGS